MISKNQKIPKLVDMLIDASGKYNMRDIAGYRWGPDAIRDMYGIIQQEYGNPLDYINADNILKYVASTGFRYAMGDDFEKEKKRYKKYSSFLHDAYTGDIESTPAIQDSLLNILMEYENEYDFLNRKGQRVAKDIIRKNLYSIPEIKKLFSAYDDVSSK